MKVGQGSPAVIANLLEMLAAEYNLNLQYRMNARTLKYIGLDKMVGKMKKYADRAHCFYILVTDRLLVLGAKPKVNVGSIGEYDSVTDLFKASLDAEQALCNLAITGIQTAVANSDECTAEKLRHIEERHERQASWFAQQLTLIASLGEAIYLSEKL